MVTELLTVDKAAQLMAVSPSFLYKLVRSKQLPAVKIGTSVRIRPEDLDTFITSNLTVMGAYDDPGYVWELQSRSTSKADGKKEIL